MHGGRNVSAARRIKRVGDTIEITGTREELRRELNVMRAAEMLGLTSGLFTVPPTSMRDGSLIQPFMRTLTPVRTRLRAQPRDTGFARRLGVVLAAVHEGLDVPDEVRRSCAAPPMSCASVVPLHGDFSVLNVLIRPEDDQVVLLDWNRAPWLGGSATHGSATSDLAVFLISLFWSPPGGGDYIAAAPQFAPAFLDGYGSRASRTITYAELGHDLGVCLGRFFPAQKQHLSKRRFALHLPARFRLRWLASSLSRRSGHL